MGRSGVRGLRGLTGDVASGLGSVRRALSRRASIEKAGARSVSLLRARVIDVPDAENPAWRVLPLRPGDESRLADIAWLTHLPRISQSRRQRLRSLSNQGAKAIQVIRGNASASGANSQGQGADGVGIGQSRRAVRMLRRLDAWAREQHVVEAVDRLSEPLVRVPRRVPLRDATAPWTGVASHLGGRPGDAMTWARPDIDQLRKAFDTLDRRTSAPTSARDAALRAANAARLPRVREVLATAPLVRLLDVSARPLRLHHLEQAGYATVADILDSPERLTGIDGVGVTTASQVIAAATAYADRVMAATPVVPDPERRSPQVTSLLAALVRWDQARSIHPGQQALALTRRLDPLRSELPSDAAALVVLGARSSAVEFEALAAQVLAEARAATPSPPMDPWASWASDRTAMEAALHDLGVLTSGAEVGTAEVPAEILEAVRAQPLVTADLTVTLRDYQDFGARFALAQRRVLLGDEMGLGKTVEALAVLAHLHSLGARRFLVICPAAVVPNWVREVSSRSRLTAHRFHGSGRDSAMAQWTAGGGVGVTTYETLPWLLEVGPPDALDATVVDEAHYIKNPRAQRTQHARLLLERSSLALLLTGTPLLNDLTEFAALVGHIRPDLVVDGHADNPLRFRVQVAPAYLRRGVEDVLTDLPEVIEVDEWVSMSPADDSAYRAAVEAGNLMGMRAAGMRAGADSAKVQRLIELVDEAIANGRKVIVYSYFLDVLELVAALIPGPVVGPLTGASSPDQRQAMVDELSELTSGGTLVAQVVAGGQGLNIQAASVVIMCEPQLTPAMEWQAIARSRRLGQTQRVQVRRLLNDEGVDVRIRDLSTVKARDFDHFARVSRVAQLADVDEDSMSESDLVAAERRRILTPDPH